MLSKSDITVSSRQVSCQLPNIKERIKNALTQIWGGNGSSTKASIALLTVPDQYSLVASNTLYIHCRIQIKILYNFYTSAEHRKHRHLGARNIGKLFFPQQDNSLSKQNVGTKVTTLKCKQEIKHLYILELTPYDDLLRRSTMYVWMWKTPFFNQQVRR